MREKRRLKREQVFADQRRKLDEERKIEEIYRSLDLPAKIKPLKPNFASKNSLIFAQELA
jgi:hypothetical protein